MEWRACFKLMTWWFGDWCIIILEGQGIEPPGQCNDWHIYIPEEKQMVGDKYVPSGRKCLASLDSLWCKIYSIRICSYSKKKQGKKHEEEFSVLSVELLLYLWKKQIKACPQLGQVSFPASVLTLFPWTLLRWSSQDCRLPPTEEAGST